MSKRMFVEGLLPKARERLVTITDDVWLIQPAILLASGSDLVIVCNSAGILAGVVTKTDVVSQICHCHGAGCITAASLAMTRDVAFCRPKGLAARCLGTHERAEAKNYSCRRSGFPPPGTSPRTRHLDKMRLSDNRAKRSFPSLIGMSGRRRSRRLVGKRGTCGRRNDQSI